MAHHSPVAKLTIAEAAERVGVSTWTIRRRIADGTITAYRVRNTRAIRLDPAEVDSLLAPMGRDSVA